MTTQADGRLAPASLRNAATPSESGPIVQGTPKDDRAQTIAHLTATVQNALGHVRTHMASAMETSSGVSRKFNMDHAFNHLGEAIEHHLKMIHQFQQYWPDIAKEYDQLEKSDRRAAALARRRMSWQYGVPVLLALVCLALTFWGLAIWSHVTHRRERLAENERIRQARSVESAHALSDRPAASD